MRRDGISYFPILESALIKKGIRKNQIQQLLNIDYSSLIKKINGYNKFTLEEAIKIQEAFIPDISINDLFKHI